MNFGDALIGMMGGMRATREGWNGKGMWVAYMPPVTYGAEKVNDRVKRLIGEGQELKCLGYFAMWTAYGEWQMGWVASQSDMSANDWLILPDIKKDGHEEAGHRPQDQHTVAIYRRKDKG